MSVTAVGGSSSSQIAQLQRQLQKDQQTLTKDEQSKAAAETLALDAAKIAADEAALAAAKSQQAIGGGAMKDKPGQTAADAVQTVESPTTKNGAPWIGSINIYA